ncbi:hypothetical protein CFP56_014783 [Quercus suber]|uniref:Uncharacterized protein n=1 Tax=Quercus suber TaxID=58331 RepID=A0AAW0KSS5_QUESU
MQLKRKRRESFQDKAGARRKVDENLQGNGLFYLFGPAIEKSGYGMGLVRPVFSESLNLIRTFYPISWIHN